MIAKGQGNRAGFLIIKCHAHAVRFQQKLSPGVLFMASTQYGGDNDDISGSCDCKWRDEKDNGIKYLRRRLACCDLEVNINGEETFMINKNILSSFSRKFSNLFGNLVDINGGVKVIFSDFPGGAHVFEVIVRLCYSSSKMEMSPSNMAQLCSAAHFLEMECNDDDGVGTPSLKPHIEKFLEGMRFWTWCELLEALKQCEGLCSSNSYLAIVDRIVDHLIERLISPGITSPYTCSSNRSSFQFSCDTSSNNSWRNNFSGATWWFEHLVFLKIDLLDKVIRTMISHDFEHGVVSRFLFHYHNLNCLGAGHTQKIETTKAVINLLSLLDLRSISCKDLFNLNRIAVGLKISTCCINKIESLIGLMLDQASIDYLLLPSPHGKDHAYDVGFVLRLIHIFFAGGSFEVSLSRLKRVAKMMDLFLVEVAPDPHLKPSEFEALITVIPDTARESHDQLYLAMDMYLKVHAGLNEKEKMSICYPLNHEKLSAELLRHLTRNLAFPSEAKRRVDVTRQSRMKTLLQENDHLKNFFDSMFRRSFKNIQVKDVEKGIYDTEELRGNFEGMQSGAELANVKKSGIHIMTNAIYLPKLCS
ncbi:hypothetical protein VNO77_22117 [Canavalia gladiata]|uniref:Uncharacterized protein n=1 Tax=Canavalia gladiata TaxID=3824 RepID=A0AAN9QE70_CANGL